jgi:5-oxoprolinase (ATP-hydrolysing)
MQAEDIASSGWRFWIDRGGTFTDIVACAPDGTLHTRKLLSDRPDQYDDAALEGIERILRNAHSTMPIAEVRMGTTVATNALLERRGARTLLVTTAGFADLLRIGTQQRPNIFAVDIVLPDMLYEAVIEADERLDADGSCLVPLDARKLQRDLETARANGIESVAIAFMHGYRNAVHEHRAAEIARAVGFTEVCASHAVSPLIKLVPRGETTLVDAYLSPVLSRYVQTFVTGLERVSNGARVSFMQSHGGLTTARGFRGKDSILSGPAGGIVGMAKTAASSGYSNVIGFDMGGTSTDVALYAGSFTRTAESQIAGLHLAIPMLDIQTVAAGGGSIVKFAAGRLQVGPESAGAAPGPAAYRNGGPATLTDANVVLGRIQADFFPAVFGPRNDGIIDPDAAALAMADLAAEIAAATGHEMTSDEVAGGALQIAVERMADAIGNISTRRGQDPTEFALCCFGGAGGQHACQVADALGIGTIIIHPLAGVLSAYGLGLAEERVVKRETFEASLSREDLDAALTLIEALATSAIESLAIDEANTRNVHAERRLLLKTAGTETPLSIALDAATTVERLAKSYIEAHNELFGFAVETTDILIDAVEVECVRASATVEPQRDTQTRTAAPIAVRSIWFAGARVATPIYARGDLPAGFNIEAPALIIEDNATTVLEPGWRARIDAASNLLMTRAEHVRPLNGPRAHSAVTSDAPDPVQLEIMNNAFMHVAEQMGYVLQRTAHSVNIRERLDFSCAIFDARGELIANAPHVPVHLGSMSDTVRAVLAAEGGVLRRGASYMSNAPYRGGTHLPDITVVTPVYADTLEVPDFIVASRAHHADVGGISPGSMPPLSKTIDEEGVIFDSVAVVENGAFLTAAVKRHLGSGKYPARNPLRNVADLKAQLAANARGAAALRTLLDKRGRETTHRYVEFMQRNAANCVHAAIAKLVDGSWRLQLDGGETICVSVTIDHDDNRATVDFTGTSPSSAGNLNAPMAVAHSAVIYVFRTLVDEDIPLNAGCMEPLRLVIPPHSLLSPEAPAAVVGGNVETSQRIADALFAALGVLASSQGTMNNFTFGDATHQYYETICGGAGASARAPGADAVHTHMTNSRLTDPELLELRFPVRLRRFEIRRGSGGSGLHDGGDGVVREFEFLTAMSAGILSNSRSVPPFGLAGGGSGACGRNYVIRADGQLVEVGGIVEMRMQPGDRFVIETPGGGAYGAPVGSAQPTS